MKAIEMLRQLVKYFDGQNETFNQRWTVEELVKLDTAADACAWTYDLDQWPEEAIQEALKDKPNHGHIDTLVGRHCDQ